LSGSLTPPLDKHKDTHSWATTLDTLRPPREKGVKIWDWRADAPIRPVIFRDQGTLDERYVHLHLEHRVVQRLLGRFVSQGFVHDDLARACVVRTDDPIPRVILLGRLSLYGANASRLHDEIVTITARWTQPVARKGKLRPHGEQAEDKTLALLEESFAKPSLHKVPKEIQAQLAQAVAQDVSELLDALHEKAEASQADAEKKLHVRGERESKEMETIISAQRDRISEMIADRQLELKLEGMEAWQREADRRHWKARLEALDGEMKTEPTRIRAGYEVKATRLDPLGIVYLWPLSN
jgi:hypothetical protein